MALKSGWVKVAHGSYGSRGGEPWSQKLAQANARTRPSDTSAGVHGAVIAPSKESLQAAIQSQTCPWCGRGPFKVLAVHANKTHGIGRIELRDLAGIPRSASICSPESSHLSREALLARPDRVEFTQKGVQAGRGVGAKVARELSATRYDAEKHGRDLEIITAVKSGMHRKQVAIVYGIAYKTVLAILKRYDAEGDGRTDRGQERKGSMPDSARAGIQKKKTRILAERTERWSALGGDHQALAQLASELGTSHKTLRQYFKSSGLAVPDGRLNHG